MSERALTISEETSAFLATLPGTDLDEKLLMLTERVNDLEHALARVVRAFDAPHREPMLGAVVNARSVLAVKRAVNQ